MKLELMGRAEGMVEIRTDFLFYFSVRDSVYDLMLPGRTGTRQDRVKAMVRLQRRVKF